jgi:hypothetical protein
MRMEAGSLDVLIGYLKSHPLAAVGLVLLAVFLLGSLLKKLVKIALVAALVLLVGLYWVDREAKADWRAQAEGLKRRAAKLGQEALEKGKQALEEGKEELGRQTGK